MDNFSADWEQKSLINELTQGMELAKQLQIHLNVTSSSHETRELLVHKILNSYDKALSMLKFKAPAAEPHPELSPRSLTGSPNSEDSDFDFKDHEHVNASRKRKSVPRWTKQVQVCPGTGLEGPLDDGFSWRKYGAERHSWGQISKAIIGAPIETSRAVWQPSKCKDPMKTQQFSKSLIEEGTPAQKAPVQLHQNQNAALGNQPQQINQHPPQTLQNPQETLLSFQTGLKVLTKDLNTENQPVSSFYFPSASLFKAENYVPSHTMTGNNLMTTTNFSPSFMSPGTSGSNYFPVSPTNMTSFDSNQALPAPESELGGIVPASAASATKLSDPWLGLPIWRFG
ncbi:WRKY family transcription factor [Actinidia rufa]|uniref:WRKY family transcription factor n=1 Tax=Actinidia rufa TaxID=165716 RepID=A0A7J0ECB3_9ERIC|nr:WRKY family transcription factor [Actinidia rufa]